MVEIEGIVTEIVFNNESNGFTVAEIKEGKRLLTAVGCMPYLSPGETVRLIGEWVTHPDYGKQLKVHSYNTVVPSTLNGIERYLASGLVEGVGPVTAKKIVERFGLDTLDIIQNHPDRLLEVPGIGPLKKEKICKSFGEQKEIREVMMFLQSYGISPNYSIKIYKMYGSQTISLIKDNPYRLARDISGIGFKTADRIAQSLGIAFDSPHRIRAGINYVLSQCAAMGHTYLPRQEVIASGSRLLQVDEHLVENALVRSIMEGEVIQEQLEDTQAVYLAPFYNAELGVCTRLVRLLSSPIPKIEVDLNEEIKRLEEQTGIEMAPAQKEAIKAGINNGVVVITGGPGTGKTTTINCIINILENQGLKTELAAPTGRAAQRMTQACGKEARTIHRLLEYGFTGDDGEGYFGRDDGYPLEADAVIVDEVSMVDILLMNDLLKAIIPGTRLILVGDGDQLPSVGPGNVLKDIILSGVVPVVRLDEIFRQAEQSMIVVNAHRINRGEYPIINSENTDFFMDRQEQPEAMLNTVIDLCVKRLPDYYGFDPLRDIQVMCPMKKGITGVNNLNIRLQHILNPPCASKKERALKDMVFREGDKVMQIKNNYRIKWTRLGGDDHGEGVFNGDVGFIEEIDLEEQRVKVLFDDDKLVEYEYSQLDELTLAYAMSVHKSQGSEFPAVVLVVAWGPPMLMTRNLLYTAVTRARELVVIVGRDRMVRAMVDNDHVAERYSGIGLRLKKLIK
ncbi:MAG TPA: ATP-dependent RecD-like DNA helicase [Clostridiales bacterium]|nr:ATP-dependent RecD-like DNA helicase [Clostridiales bacterium]